MAGFVAFTGSQPVVFLGADGLISGRPGRPVHLQAVLDTDSDHGLIRLSLHDPGVRPLATWLNANRSVGRRNTLAAAPAGALDELRRELEGAWDITSVPGLHGPTSLFTTVAGFMDEVLDAHRREAVKATGTLARWNRVLAATGADIFALRHGRAGARLAIGEVVQQFGRSLLTNADE
ncbi:MAG TPA: hypothetical protein VN289_15610 [Paraburkholderia sp.]|jgi:hypothetical protein|nr:hypothetical protein [Paraburkholderia sp.]